MSMTMLVPLEMAESGRRVIEAAEEIARAWPGDITLLHVVTARDTLADPEILTRDREVLSNWEEVLRSCGVSRVSAELARGVPWLEIGNRTEEEDIACVLMGSHGKGRIARMLLGSQTANVLARGRKSLLIVRLKEVRGREDACLLAVTGIFSRILFAVDSPAAARKHIPAFAWMARTRPEEFALVHVMDQAAEEDLPPAEHDSLIEDMKRAGFPDALSLRCSGDPARGILRLAEERNSTLIVLGAKDKHGIRERALGSVTETVVHNARAHVLVVR